MNDRHDVLGCEWPANWVNGGRAAGWWVGMAYRLTMTQLASWPTEWASGREYGDLSRVEDRVKPG